MQVHISPSMRRITISTTNGFFDPMKLKGAARYLSYRCLFCTILALVFLLPLAGITTMLATLEGADTCTGIYCLTRKFGPRAPWKSDSALNRDAHDLVVVLEQAAKAGLPTGGSVPESINVLLDVAKAQKYDTKTLLLSMTAMVETKAEQVRAARLQEALYLHFASSGVPKGMHCLSLKLTSEYSTNALARQDLPSPDLAPGLTDNTLHHFVVATDNVLAASVVVSSTVKNAANPQRIVFHVVTDQKTYAAMHSWFSLHPLSPAIVEVKGVHQFDWLTKDNIPVLEVLESSADIVQYYHGDHSTGADLTDSPTILAAKLQARSPKYISIMNHLRIYLPDLFPELTKVVFLDDDVVVQRDLAPLFDEDMHGKVNGAVETCRGEDPSVGSKTFRNYFNFSNPLMANAFNKDQCAWAYGMNIFDLKQWRKTEITKIYHRWQKLNLKSHLTLWRLGTLPPALIAFDGYVHPISSSWHMLGLGYHSKSNIESIKRSGVIHYNGQAKPWLEIGFAELRPFWAKYVVASIDFYASNPGPKYDKKIWYDQMAQQPPCHSLLLRFSCD